MIDGEPAVYMPVLKWKLGEQSALKPLNSAQKSKLLPIAELQDRPVDWETNRYSKSWDDHIDAVVKKTVTHWGKTHEIGFDQDLTEEDKLLSHPGTPWAYLFDELWGAGVQAVPVLSSRASLAELSALVAAAKGATRDRFILRFRVPPPKEDELVPDVAAADVADWLQQMLLITGASPSRLDVAFDCDCVSQWNLASKAAWVAAVMVTMHAVAPWRSVFLVSGGFPKNLAGLSKGTHQIPRHDWLLYNKVRPLVEGLGYPVRFGDYAISHVDPFDADPRMLKMSANLRYAQADSWFVIKGSSVRDNGFDQYVDMCKLLIGLPVYLQRTFSHGDRNYHDVATLPGAGPGNATHWRRDATNHHLHVVLRQLAGGSLP